MADSTSKVTLKEEELSKEPTQVTAPPAKASNSPKPAAPVDYDAIHRALSGARGDQPNYITYGN